MATSNPTRPSARRVDDRPDQVGLVGDDGRCRRRAAPPPPYSPTHAGPMPPPPLRPAGSASLRPAGRGRWPDPSSAGGERCDRRVVAEPHAAPTTTSSDTAETTTAAGSQRSSSRDTGRSLDELGRGRQQITTGKQSMPTSRPVGSPSGRARRRRRTASPASDDVAGSEPLGGAGRADRPATAARRAGAGPRRRARADRPVPAAWCHAQAVATGDVSTAASSSTATRCRARRRRAARLGSTSPRRVGDRLDDPRLVGDQHLGHEPRPRPALHRPASSRAESDAGPAVAPARRSGSVARPTGSAPGSTAPLVTNGGPSLVVADGVDQPVVLVAEVRRRSSARSPSGAGDGERRERSGRRALPVDDAGPRAPVRRPATELERQRADQHLGVERPLR